MVRQNNTILKPLEWCDSRIEERQNDYRIADVFDLVFPHMSLLEPGHHCDGAGAAICRCLHRDLFFVIFGLLLGIAGCSRTTVWRGSGVVIWRVQVSRVILISLCTLLIVPFKTFYREGPAVLCTPEKHASLLLNLVCPHHSVPLPLQDSRWLTSRRPPVGLSTVWIQEEGPAPEVWAHSPRMLSGRCHRVCRYLSGYICGLTDIIDPSCSW